MRIVPLLVLLICGLPVSAAPEMAVVTAPAGAAATAADDANYQALQTEADLALATLRQAEGRRVAAL